MTVRINCLGEYDTFLKKNMHIMHTVYQKKLKKNHNHKVVITEESHIFM